MNVSHMTGGIEKVRKGWVGNSTLFMEIKPYKDSPGSIQRRDFLPETLL